MLQVCIHLLQIKQIWDILQLPWFNITKFLTGCILQLQALNEGIYTFRKQLFIHMVKSIAHILQFFAFILFNFKLDLSCFSRLWMKIFANLLRNSPRIHTFFVLNLIWRIRELIFDCQTSAKDLSSKTWKVLFTLHFFSAYEQNTKKMSHHQIGQGDPHKALLPLLRGHPKRHLEETTNTHLVHNKISRDILYEVYWF
jgi:hypothetical protein